MVAVESRAPHGARGLKSASEATSLSEVSGRAPHGARGLKFNALLIIYYHLPSRPARGAWIEILLGQVKLDV